MHLQFFFEVLNHTGWVIKGVYFDISHLKKLYVTLVNINL